MGQNENWKYLACVAIAAAGIAAAVLLGAPLLAAAVAVFAGIGAAFLAPRSQETVAPAAERPRDPLEPTLPPTPDAIEVLNAVDEPRLIVRNRRVLIANQAAKAMLGAHIEGVDVRLAIRHPAAADQLTGRSEDAGPGLVRTELVGLGEPGRRWEMTTSALADGSRLVRLVDRSQAHAAEQMRADFVANASHELRTPLATVTGFIETLQDESAASDPQIRARFLKIMADEAIRMRQLVDDLMSLSRIEADRFTVPRDPVDVLPLLSEVKSSLNRLAAERGSETVIDAATDQTVVAGDHPQLAQLFTNLVENALKYGRAGRPVRIRVEDAGPELVQVSVADEGDGIAPEHLPRLTERFYRVDPGRSRSVGGTGLGLAIVKHIVGRHRGRLDIRSTLGAGTTVQVLLPRAQSQLLAGAAAASMSSKGNVSPPFA